MENPELLLLEIEEFNRTSSSQDDKIPQNLENFIEYVSRTGTYIFPWNLVKKLFLKKLTNIINSLQSCMSLSTSDLNTSSSSSHLGSQNISNDGNNIQLIKDRIIERMKSFTSAPFTIQRICELLLKPNNHYNKIDKYLRGLEKCIMVVTTVDPSGNKIFMENGLSNGTIPSNLSSPSVTPTRPLTPPELKTETAAGEDSLMLTTTKADSSPSDADASSVASNQVTPSKSTTDEPPPKYLPSEDSNDEQQAIEAKEDQESNYEPVRATATDENLIESYEAQINPAVDESVQQNNQLERQDSVCEVTSEPSHEMAVSGSTDMIISEEADEIMDVVTNKPVDMEATPSTADPDTLVEAGAEQDAIPCEPIPEINPE